MRSLDGSGKPLGDELNEQLHLLAVRPHVALCVLSYGR